MNNFSDIFLSGLHFFIFNRLLQLLLLIFFKIYMNMNSSSGSFMKFFLIVEKKSTYYYILPDFLGKSIDKVLEMHKPRFMAVFWHKLLLNMFLVQLYTISLCIFLF